ncbi:MAG: peptide ABC transporter substrate-binding protein, partial [Planctomycetota bacterium]
TGAPYSRWLEPLEGAPAWRRRAAARGPGEPWPPAPAGLQLAGRRIGLRFTRPLPYFAEMCAYHALAPVPPALRNRGPSALSPSGSAAGWVGSGPFRLERRRLRDRLRVVPNPEYWEAGAVRLAGIDFLTVDSPLTGLNLFLTGEADYLPDVPALAVEGLLERERRRAAEARRRGETPPPREFAPAPFLATYFYRINVTRPPLDDPRVRRALVLAVDRRALAAALGAGQPPAGSFTPPWIEGYAPPHAAGFDPPAARALLAAAGFPEGKGLRPLELLFNSSAAHREVAEVLQEQWSRNLGLRTRLSNQEWKVFLDSQRRLDYDLSRSSWIGDYQDPSTFLDIFRSEDGNNRTGWKDARYDRLLGDAEASEDPAARADLFRQAEEHLLEAAPLLPLFHYQSLELVSERVAGLTRNLRSVIDWAQVRLRPEEP